MYNVYMYVCMYTILKSNNYNNILEILYTEISPQSIF